MELCSIWTGVSVSFNIAAWHCVVFGHVPYLLLQRCGHNEHDRLVPFSTVFCNNHILLRRHSTEEERDELNFVLFSITGWQCVALILDISPTCYYNVANTTDTAISHRPPPSFVTTILSPVTTELKKKKECSYCYVLQRATV